MTYFQLLGPFLLATFSISFLLVQRRFPHLRSAIYFAASYASLACALTLDWLRVSFDPVVATYLTNIPYLSTAVFFAAGLFQVNDRDVPWRSITGAGLAVFLGVLWFRHVQPDLIMRTVVMTFGVSAILLYAVFRVLPHAPAGLKRAILWALALSAVLAIVRTVLTLMAEAETLSEQTYATSAVSWTLQLTTAMSALAVAVLLFAHYGLQVMRMLTDDGVRRVRQVEEQFSKFLSPSVVETLMASEGRDLAVQTRTISVLLVDLRGFTTYAQVHGSDAASAHVNRFLAVATEEIMNRNGTIDKYLGDAVLAFWNAPLLQEDHADLAIDTALAIQTRLRQLAEPMEAVAIVESGECSVGNHGTDQRMDYTAVGGAMNVVSRLEKVAKTRSVDVLVGPQAAELAQRDLQPIGDIVLPGITHAVRIHATNPTGPHEG
ncbi:adenylate/guanylate cyclase domain-containing protein [Marivita hallyeonensis]|uniref:adenylate/guanylate cyclase domain-containing protein n=1 Tax=Marivita hallyeonensis TaxID=996342 RepID=UPI0015B6ACCF|nr:adenylate/guanylate cyclase domain-containing protein [Marivita hallyeonensis]